MICGAHATTQGQSAASSHLFETVTVLSRNGNRSIPNVSGIAHAVRQRGGRALVVGGWVRDRLLGIDATEVDVDMEIFGVPAGGSAGLLAPFGKVEPIGKSFPVYKIGHDRHRPPPPRIEKRTGHKGFIVEGDPSMSIEDAARRRDFTVNAIAWDPLTGVHEDPFNGRADIERKVLRAVDPATFADDSLRVLRAVQFAARFEMSLDEPRRRCAARSDSTICRRSASGERSKSCCSARGGHRLDSRWRWSWASWISCFQS